MSCKDEYRQKANERDKKDKELEKYDARKRRRMERDPLHQGIIVERSNLKQRDFQIDLASRLGKTQVVGVNTPLSQQVRASLMLFHAMRAQWQSPCDTCGLLRRNAVKLHNTALSQAGFYCGVCDCVLKDSMSYLDHINGKWHNRNLGMTMRVEKSTVEQVCSAGRWWCERTSRVSVS